MLVIKAIHFAETILDVRANTFLELLHPQRHFCNSCGVMTRHLERAWKKQKSLKASKTC